MSMIVILIILLIVALLVAGTILFVWAMSHDGWEDPSLDNDLKAIIKTMMNE